MMVISKDMVAFRKETTVVTLVGFFFFPPTLLTEFLKVDFAYERGRQGRQERVIGTNWGSRRTGRFFFSVMFLFTFIPIMSI